MAEVQGISRLVAQLDRRRNETRRATQKQVVVGYTAEYAVYVHENLEAFHPVGEAKFLEKPIRIYRRDMARGLRQRMAKGMPFDRAGLEVGRILQGLSQDICPVDTGFLRSSAFTRLE